MDFSRPGSSTCSSARQGQRKAFAEEKSRKQLVLFPIRLDNAVMETTEAWAGKLRYNRNIGDFRRWKNHDAYEKALERVLRDLKVTQAAP